MKAKMKDSEKQVGWEQMRSPSAANHHGRGCSSKVILWLILFVSVTYFVYTLKLVSYPKNCDNDGLSGDPFSSAASAGDPRLFSAITTQLASTQLDSGKKLSESNPEAVHPLVLLPTPVPKNPSPTNISHIVFGIGGSSKLWKQRKEYIKIWYKPDSGMRGVVWLDNHVNLSPDDAGRLPPVKISGDTSRFAYRNRKGHRSAIRISRIVSETLRLGLQNVRWFVLGDDDTVFVTENLVRVLAKYDHTQYYYIGSSSESHLQNIHFSYAMAYGGGGFAISYPLAVALEKMQDRCMQRYPGLYGSDDRMQACMAELGVPLTKVQGFHQNDVYGDLFGLLAAHPVTPLVSLHHLDVVDPIFPDLTRVQALQRLLVPMKLDSAGLMQQSICYDRSRTWTISVSWGFAVQVIRGVISPREMEMPTRTFLNWYKRGDFTAYAFNTRPVFRNPCQKPFVFYMDKARMSNEMNRTVTEYARHQSAVPSCTWKTEDPSILQTVMVYKKADPQLWDRSRRRNCCRVLNSKSQEKMVIDVGVCKEGEVTEIVTNM